MKAARLSRELQGLGLVRGSLVMVHAGLRKVGPIEGGANALIDTIIDVLGPDGTMIMMIAADDSDPFDALATEVDVEDMGILAEIFRRRTGVRVNDQPASRFAALGPLASEIIDNPPLHDYYGPGSPLERFVERGGQVLRLGAPIDTVTLTHYAEYRASVPNKRRVRRRYVRADTGEQWIESLDDSGGIADWPGGDYFAQILLDFLAEGRARVGPVGQCIAELLDGPAFIEFAVAWMETHLAAPRRI